MNLKQLILVSNKISSIKELDPKIQIHLEYLNISNNNIRDLVQVRHLKAFKSLETLHINNNPFFADILTTPSKLQETCIFDINSQKGNVLPDLRVRLWLIFELDQLDILDNLPVLEEEKVHSNNEYNPTVEFITALQHSLIIQQQIKKYMILNLKPFLSLEIYIPIIVCGPKGVGKR